MEEKVKVISNLLNTMSFDEKKFCEMFGKEHRTLQQNFTRLCLVWIKHLSTVEHYDDRNEASVLISKEIVEKVQDLRVPFI